MAQGRSTKIMSMIKRIQTSRFSINNSLTLQGVGLRGRLPQRRVFTLGFEVWGLGLNVDGLVISVWGLELGFEFGGLGFWV